MRERRKIERTCSKVACARPAEHTLTWVYADQQAVIGPLSVRPEPHSYDLCGDHAVRMTVPQGWHVVRYRPEPDGL